MPKGITRPQCSPCLKSVSFSARRSSHAKLGKFWRTLVGRCPDRHSLQNKIWNLPDRSTISPKFIYGKQGKLAGLTPVLPVRVRGPALILKTADRKRHTATNRWKQRDTERDRWSKGPYNNNSFDPRGTFNSPVDHCRQNPSSSQGPIYLVDQQHLSNITNNICL